MDTMKMTSLGSINIAVIGVATRTCDAHGKYQANIWQYKEHRFESGCPMCEKEEEDKVKAEVEKKESERKQRNRERKFEQRGIPRRFKETKLSDYIADTDRKKEVLGIIEEYIAKQDEVSQMGRSLLLYGNVGTGKTRLATSIVKGWEGVGYYITAREYTRLIRSTYSGASKETEQDVIDRFTDYSVLVIDEIGKQFSTDNERFAIFDIINSRYNEMKPTVLVSNMSIGDIEEFLGKATVDRIKEHDGQAILFDWESFRQRREEDEV